MDEWVRLRFLRSTPAFVAGELLAERDRPNPYGKGKSRFAWCQTAWYFASYELEATAAASVTFPHATCRRDWFVPLTKPGGSLKG